MSFSKTKRIVKKTMIKIKWIASAKVRMPREYLINSTIKNFSTKNDFEISFLLGFGLLAQNLHEKACFGLVIFFSSPSEISQYSNRP